jgi:molecular chaperone DnaJ/curved DNA-binding protein
MFKNYYLILGVPRTADPESIRSAYRDLAKRHHPDRIGPGGATKFKQIREAYEVLADPLQRARLDRQIDEAEGLSARSGGWSEREPEPLVSEPMNIGDRPGSVSPSFEAFIERIARNFTGLGVPKAEREEALNFELIMSPDEAERGAIIPFSIPVFRVCSWCGGSGDDWGFPCSHCDAEGRTVGRGTLRVRVPAGVRPGTVIEVPLNRLGVDNFYLRVHIRIARQ